MVKKKKTGNIPATIGITAIFIVLGLSLYILSYMRLIESVRDLGLSFGYYFCEIFGITHNITPTVCEKSGIKNELFFNISFELTNNFPACIHRPLFSKGYQRF